MRAVCIAYFPSPLGSPIEGNLEFHFKKRTFLSVLREGQRQKITDIFYICGDHSLLRKIKGLSYGITGKTYWFVLLSELMHFKADAPLRSHSQKATLKELLEQSSDRTVDRTVNWRMVGD